MSIILSALAFVFQRASAWRAERFVKLAIPPSHKRSKSVSTACKEVKKLNYSTSQSFLRHTVLQAIRRGQD